MNIDELCAAVKDSLHYLKDVKFDSKTDHSLVELFQANIKDYLNTIPNGYSWRIEEPARGRFEKDSIDIFGCAKDSPNWIIEIDATRTDQVSQKFISRLALWGLDAEIHYVAILYPYSKEDKNSCEKYLRYCSEILRKINKKSSLTGIFVDPTVDSIEIQQHIVHGKKTTDHFDVDGKECNSMSEAAEVAIKLYLKKHPSTFSQLKDYWGRFVEDSDRSRAKCINVKTTDGITVYTYVNFRQYGLAAYWPEFERLCKKKKIIISKMRKYYVGDDALHQYKYQTGWGDFWKKRLSLIKDDIVEYGCRPIIPPKLTSKDYDILWVRHHKGIIVPNDDNGYTCAYVKKLLGYENLVNAKKVSDIKIDSSWPLGDSEADFHELWDKIIRAAKEADNGLLVMNVSDIRLFRGDNIWCVKQLAKQEWEDIPLFQGYVLLVLDNLDWNQVHEYASMSNKGEFEAMKQFYKRIQWDEE